MSSLERNTEPGEHFFFFPSKNPSHTPHHNGDHFLSIEHKKKNHFKAPCVCFLSLSLSDFFVFKDPPSTNPPPPPPPTPTPSSCTQAHLQAGSLRYLRLQSSLCAGRSAWKGTSLDSGTSIPPRGGSESKHHVPLCAPMIDINAKLGRAPDAFRAPFTPRS